MRDKFLKKIAELSAKKPGTVLILALIITVIATLLSLNLKLSMHMKDLMPQSHPLVQEFNKIMDDYDTASTIIIAAKGNEEELKNFADELAKKIENEKEYISRVNYKMNTEFMKTHGMMLQKVKDLKNSKNLYSDMNLIPWLTHLNDSFEKTYIDDDESISNKQKELNAVQMLGGINNIMQAMENFSTQKNENIDQVTDDVVQKFLLGEPYMLSQDKDMIMLFAQPNFTINEMDKVVNAIDRIEEIITEVSKDYPGIYAGTSGLMALARDEMVSAKKDINYTTIIALILILILFIVSFRMWVAPIFAGITMVIGLIWTAGFAAITVGSLNMMTSMFGVIILGLGIDFSIHIISIFQEFRTKGLSVEIAMKDTLLKSGGGIITGALTTGFAFYTLMISNSAGMFQFGLVSGSGVIICMLATMFVLPAMLSFREKRMRTKKQKKAKKVSTDFKLLGAYSNFIIKYPKTILTIGIFLTAFFAFFASKIQFDYNYLNMEPLGLKSIELQHEIEDKFDMTPDYAFVSTSSIEESKIIAEQARDLKMIGFVSSISDYIPSKEEQLGRTKLINEIKIMLENGKKIEKINAEEFPDLIDQIGRLQDNIIELAQLAFMGGQDKVDKKAQELIGDFDNPNFNGSIGDLLEVFDKNDKNTLNGINDFADGFSQAFKKYALQMTSTEEITLNSIPEDIKKQFVSNNGDEYLVTIYPKESVWNLNFLEHFKVEMEKLDKRITGMPIVFFNLIDIIGADGKNAAVFAIFIIFLLLLLDFRNIKFSLIAMVPLVVGAIWMIGIMQLLGLPLTLVNVMGLPLILGIGVDDGVHILHRYKVEKKGNIPHVFLSTGKAVLITSLTTMLAFGSLKFATYRGLGSLGMALFIGVGACFIVTVTFLPAILALINKDKTDK